MTSSERIVANLCEKTFLSFWSFPSPKGKKDKELCDLLVICEPDIIIFSVKDISINSSGDPSLDTERWIKRAIYDSADQIYGAERIIQLKDEVILSDRVTKVKLPAKNIRKIFRIAVAFGRGEKYPLVYGDLGKGFVHVFDERSIQIILKELDTIKDFTRFLEAKEKYSISGVKQFAFSAEDYLALHFQYGFESLPKGHDVLHLSDDMWTGYSESREYLEEQTSNKISYIWDSIIKTLYDDFVKGDLNQARSREEMELILRQMNREDRFGRRQLSTCFNELIHPDSIKTKMNSRILKSLTDSTVGYVFLTRPFHMRDERTKEIVLRCFVAKSLFPELTEIIGIATEKFQPEGSSIDVSYYHFPTWCDEWEQKAREIREELGYFRAPKMMTLKPDGSRHF